MGIADALKRAIYWLEVVTAVILIVITAAAVVTLIVDFTRVTIQEQGLGPSGFALVIASILEVFILIELFRIALAYMAHKNVLPTVLEAALVAVARKFVVFETGEMDPMAIFWKSSGLAILLLAVSISWWVLNRANACDACTMEE